MNEQLLLKVKKRILSEPAQFIMGQFKSNNLEIINSYEVKRKKIPNCGTACCIAGWTVAIGEKKKPSELKTFDSDIEHDALRLLDLQYKDIVLFYTDKWPLRFRNLWNACKTLKGRAKIAADRIDYFIKNRL